jgi:hypothetical protein
MALTVRTDQELDEALTALAAAEGLSKQEIIRRAVLAAYTTYDRRVRLSQILDAELPRYAEALDRLGQ